MERRPGKFKDLQNIKKFWKRQEESNNNTNKPRRHFKEYKKGEKQQLRNKMKKN